MLQAVGIGHVKRIEKTSLGRQADDRQRGYRGRLFLFVERDLCRQPGAYELCPCLLYTSDVYKRQY